MRQVGFRLSYLGYDRTVTVTELTAPTIGAALAGIKQVLDALNKEDLKQRIEQEDSDHDR